MITIYLPTKTSHFNSQIIMFTAAAEMKRCTRGGQKSSHPQKYSQFDITITRRTEIKQNRLYIWNAFFEI